MISFFRTENCKGCKDIQEALEELCLAHKVVIISKDNPSSEALPEGTKPPVLVDGDEIIDGYTNIITHLEKIEEFKKEWDKFQSDACYCDEEE